MLTGLAIGENLCHQQCPAVFTKHMKALTKPFHQVTKLLASVPCNSEEMQHIQKKKDFKVIFLKPHYFFVSLLSLQIMAILNQALEF